MSLIRDALREMGSTPQSAPQLPKHPALAPDSPSNSWWIAGALVLAVLSGVAVWFWMQPHRHPQPPAEASTLMEPSPLPQTKNTPDAARSQAGLPGASQAALAVAPAAASVGTPAATLATTPVATPVATSVAASQTVPQTAPIDTGAQERPITMTAEESAERHRPASSKTPSAKVSTRVSLATASARKNSPQPTGLAQPAMSPPAAEPAPPPVETTYALFSQALATGDLASAREQLTRLEQGLPAESLTLLRARAWFLMRTQDVTAARAAYQTILDRLPGDENASLNLASIEVAGGHVEAARRLLTLAIQSNPDSQSARQALTRLGIRTP